MMSFEISSADQRQEYADSWPDSIDDSQTRDHLAWKAEFGLGKMVEEMISKLQHPS